MTETDTKVFSKDLKKGDKIEAIKLEQGINLTIKMTEGEAKVGVLIFDSQGVGGQQSLEIKGGGYGNTSNPIVAITDCRVTLTFRGPNLAEIKDPPITRAQTTDQETKDTVGGAGPSHDSRDPSPVRAPSPEDSGAVAVAGPSQDSIASTPSSNPREVILTTQQGFGLRLETNETISCTVTKGRAEIFGTEMILNTQYTFNDRSNIYIYTFDPNGCTVSLEGNNSIQKAEKANKSKIVNLRIVDYMEQCKDFHEIREKSKGRGPVVLVVGDTDTGKSTLCRILLNSAVIRGSTPIFVELDVGQNGISIPGTIGAVVVKQPADIVEGFLFDRPLVYSLGRNSPTDLMDFYELLIQRLSVAVDKRMEKYPNVGKSGVIINTCGFIKNNEKDNEYIGLVIDDFKVDTVLALSKNAEEFVLGLKRPHLIVKGFDSPRIHIITRSTDVRTQARNKKIRDYFNGGSELQLAQNIEFDFHKFDKDKSNKDRVALFPFREHQNNNIYAVSNIKRPVRKVKVDPNGLKDESVAGFVRMTENRYRQQILVGPDWMTGNFLEKYRYLLLSRISYPKQN